MSTPFRRREPHPPGEVFLFSSYGFGRRFQRRAVVECRRLGLRLTILMADPVRRMGRIRRLRTRTTRPLRRMIELCRLRARVWLVEDANSAGFRARVPSHCHAVITGYGQIFRRPTIDCFASFVNFHPSLLPYYRGPAPVHWCVANREPRSGLTVHEVTEAIDDGPVLRQAVVDISQPGDPTQAIVDAALPVFCEWLEHLAGCRGFPIEQVDAASVYQTHVGYRSHPHFNDGT